MRAILTATLPLLAALAALAPAPAPATEAAAPWPMSAQGRPLPRPAWVLVIPARRKPGGGLAIWERDDAWTRAWRVPRLVRGVRMVSLLGDAEDRRAVTAAAIDGMMVDSLAAVMRKYGAPALALAVTDGSSVALAGYVPGHAASWLPADAGADEGATREASLATLAALFGARGAPAAETARDSSREAAVEILAVRDRDDGGFDYRLRLAGTDAAGLRRQLAGTGARLEEMEPGDAAAVVSSPDDIDAFSAALRARGLTVR